MQAQENKAQKYPEFITEEINGFKVIRDDLFVRSTIVLQKLKLMYLGKRQVFQMLSMKWWREHLHKWRLLHPQWRMRKRAEQNTCLWG